MHAHAGALMQIDRRSISFEAALHHIDQEQYRERSLHIRLESCSP